MCEWLCTISTTVSIISTVSQIDSRDHSRWTVLYVNFLLMLSQSDADSVCSNVRTSTLNTCSLTILRSQSSERKQKQAQNRWCVTQNWREWLIVIEKRCLQRDLSFFQILRFSIWRSIVHERSNRKSLARAIFWARLNKSEIVTRMLMSDRVVKSVIVRCDWRIYFYSPSSLWSVLIWAMPQDKWSVEILLTAREDYTKTKVMMTTDSSQHLHCEILPHHSTANARIRFDALSQLRLTKYFRWR